MARPRGIGDKIKYLRYEEGYTYPMIEKELGCTRSTISYHVGINEKENNAKRRKKMRASDAFYRRALAWDFNTPKGKALLEKYGSRVNVIRDYIRDVKQGGVDRLTGKPLDEDNEVHLDHWIPKVDGGSNEVTNCAVLNRKSNQVKSYLRESELVEFCIDVLRYRGFIVEKK